LERKLPFPNRRDYAGNSGYFSGRRRIAFGENIISNYGRKEITNFIRYDSTLTGCGDTNTTSPLYDLTPTLYRRRMRVLFLPTGWRKWIPGVRLSKLSGQLVAYEYGLLLNERTPLP
jgi:hypothetical protein